jgi:hypothetical protein
MYYYMKSHATMILSSANGANYRLCSIVGAAESGVIVVAIDGHEFTEASIIRSIIYKLGVARGGGDASAVVGGVNTTG